MSRRRRTESHNTPGVRGHEVFLGPSTGCGVGAGHSAPWAQTGRVVQRLEPLNGSSRVGVRDRVLEVAAATGGVSSARGRPARWQRGGRPDPEPAAYTGRMAVRPGSVS
jgi:hypothetical protein